jgi:hypothetical protein
MAGKGKAVYTLAPEAVEPDLMNLLLGPAEHICTSVDELLERLGGQARTPAADFLHMED